MTHLHPTSFLFRAAEAQHILAKATFEPNAIVMGDLNSLAESDDLPSFALLSPNTRARLLNEEGTVRGSAVSIFLKHDFVDLGAERSSPTYPTRLFEKDTRDGIKLRLDYMLVTHRIAELAEFSTISNLKAQLASDHLPLLCKLRT
jgi:endonuclease/exonuclease/phosphatase family metal-dependent hydrolase